MSRKILVIDQSSIYNFCLYATRGPNYMPRFSELRQEYALNYLRYLMWLKDIFKPDITYFCRDTKPYWRCRVMDEFYAQPDMVKLSREVESETYYLEVDLITYRWQNRENSWVEKKLTIKDKEAILDTFPIKFEEIEKGSDLWHKINYRIPGYKKRRHIDRKWEFEENQELMEQTERATCFHGASLLNGKVLELKFAEADDLALAVSRFHKDDIITYVSVDEDWRQFIGNKKYDCLWRPKEREFYSKSGVMLYMWEKIFCGDSSDEYRAVIRTNDKKPVTVRKQTVQHIFNESGSKGLMEYGEKNCDSRFKRNMKLALINQMPKVLLEQAMTLVENIPLQPKGVAPIQWGWNDEEEANHKQRVNTDFLEVSQRRNACIRDWEKHQ